MSKSKALIIAALALGVTSESMHNSSSRRRHHHCRKRPI